MRKSVPTVISRRLKAEERRRRKMAKRAARAQRATVKRQAGARPEPPEARL